MKLLSNTVFKANEQGRLLTLPDGGSWQNVFQKLCSISNYVYDNDHQYHEYFDQTKLDV